MSIGSSNRGFISYKYSVKAARDNSPFCVGHGGGVRCSIEECKKSAVGKTGLCTKHKQELAKGALIRSHSGESSN